MTVKTQTVLEFCLTLFNKKL